MWTYRKKGQIGPLLLEMDAPWWWAHELPFVHVFIFIITLV